MQVYRQTTAVYPRHLLIIVGVEVQVVEDDRVGCGQVDAQTTWSTINNLFSASEDLKLLYLYFSNLEI